MHSLLKNLKKTLVTFCANALIQSAQVIWIPYCAPLPSEARTLHRRFSFLFFVCELRISGRRGKPYHSADLLQNLFVGRDAGVLGLVALPEEAGDLPPPLSDMAVQAVVSDVTAPAIKPGVLNLARAYIKVAVMVVLSELQSRVESQR